jgi:hypothetical protein
MDDWPDDAFVGVVTVAKGSFKASGRASAAVV